MLASAVLKPTVAPNSAARAAVRPVEGSSSASFSRPASGGTEGGMEGGERAGPGFMLGDGGNAPHMGVGSGRKIEARRSVRFRTTR